MNDSYPPPLKGNESLVSSHVHPPPPPPTLWSLETWPTSWSKLELVNYHVVAMDTCFTFGENQPIVVKGFYTGLKFLNKIQYILIYTLVKLNC